MASLIFAISGIELGSDGSCSSAVAVLRQRVVSMVVFPNQTAYDGVDGPVLMHYPRSWALKHLVRKH